MLAYHSSQPLPNQRILVGPNNFTWINTHQLAPAVPSKKSVPAKERPAAGAKPPPSARK